MISWITIVLFFVYCLGLGFTALSFVQKKPELRLERFCLAIALGLGIFPILAVLLNFVHIPLDWKIFLGLSLVWPIVVFIRKIKGNELNMPQFSFTKSELMLCGAIALMLLSLFMYTKGAFAYPYLEDEDPWGHAVGAKYVALEKTAYDPVLKDQKKIDEVLSYIDPYPPAYDVLIGILHQTSPDLNWTIKFFNALIISLGVLFFYLFAKEFVGNSGKALLATLFLAMIPAYLSHFIWAHSYVVTLFFPVMYALLMIKEDRKWVYVAVIIVASIWVTQNIEQPIKLTTMLLLFVIVASVVRRQFMKWEFAAICGGVVLSFVWWGMMIWKYGFKGMIQYYTGEKIVSSASSSTLGSVSPSFLSSLSSKVYEVWRAVTSPGGSGSRAYSFDDFFYAKSANAINNPIGIGIVLSLLVLVGLVWVLWRYRKSLTFHEENLWLCVTLFWLVYTFWGVNGQTFPFSIARGPFRIWMLLAISVTFVAMEGTYFLMNVGKKFKVPTIIVGSLIILGVVMTSGVAKFEHNTMIWPTSGTFTSSAQEPWEYGAWFASIPPNTNVFLYAPRDKVAMGFGANSCIWCEGVLSFRENILERTGGELHTFLKQQKYEYLVLNYGMDFKYTKGKYGEEKTKALLEQRYTEVFKHGLFEPVYQKENMFVVFKVK